MIARSQYEALVDQSVDDDEAAAQAHSDRNFGITLAERAIAANGIGRLPAPMNTVIGDTFMLSFDRVLARAGPLPEPQTAVRAGDLFDAQNQGYLDHRSYLIAMAKQDAGEFTPEKWDSPLPANVFDESGALRPFDDIPRQPESDPLRDLRNIAISPPDATPPPETPDWATSLQNSGETYNSYDPRGYTDEDNPDTFVTNQYRDELLYGKREWIDYIYGDDGYPGSVSGQPKI